MNPYEREIREYLIGRLEKHHRSDVLSARVTSALPTRRLMNWWIFEGRRYPGMTRPLALEWESVIRRVDVLQRMYNPRWRAVQLPEGDVDWISTAVATTTSHAPEYVCRTSRLGMTPEEKAVLAAWSGWIAQRWSRYCEHVDVPAGAMGALPWTPATRQPSKLELQRWALTARRSRWSIMRDIVAETLRVVFEPAVLDRIPLPTEPSTLFELLCIVRVLRTLAPDSSTLRWLDRDAAKNELAVEGVRCLYQRSFSPDAVLATAEYDAALIAATRRHGLRVHRNIDLLVVFAQPRAGFHGIILEAKSGNQRYDESIAQLKHYRAAVKRERGGRWLVWGVREDDARVEDTEAALADVIAEGAHREDVWFFSPASAIPLVLRKLGIAA